MPLVLDTPFGFAIDLSFWIDLFTQPSRSIVADLYAIIGWTVLALIFFFMGKEMWVNYRSLKYTKKWKWVVLAVDIPLMFIQTPKAVEQIFAQFSGAQIGNNIGQKFWLGRKQKWFSLEIISIEGYIQFLIRTEIEFRDLVEAAIYAQYPEAEITEVEDYVDFVPKHYPDDEYDIFGVEFALHDKDAYPIRTYPSFEYNLSKDAVFSDPMAAILENFSRISKGENFWFQIIIEPTGSDWKEKGIELVKGLVTGKKAPKKESVMSKVGSLPVTLAKQAVKIWEWNFEAEEAAKEAPAGKVSDLTPGMKDTVQAIEEKISKIGFKSKIRAMYVARKDVYNPSRCIDGFIGSLNQFHVMGRNAVVPHAATLAHYWRKAIKLARKKAKFAEAYKKRKIKAGSNPYVLNIEELATLWHFPLPFVKTPSMQRAQTKRGEPPMNLPIESMEKPLRVKKVEAPEPPKPMEETPPPPEDLPFA